MQVEMLLSGGGRVPAWPGAAANKLLQCCEDARSVPEWFSSTLKCLLKRCCQFHIFLFKIPFFFFFMLATSSISRNNPPVLLVPFL